ncbi:MAG: hypothetical protein ABSF84_17420 [Acidimicrobiales bacterium]|jgi:hypothetical protein
MGILFLLGMMVFSAGVLLLFQSAVRWSFHASRGERGEAGRSERIDVWAVPDTVPPEWIDAYRTEQGG